MKKVTKRLFVIILAVAMVFSTASFAWAEDVVTEPEDGGQPVVMDNEGEPADEPVVSDEGEPVIGDEDPATEETEQDPVDPEEPVIIDEIEEAAASEEPLKNLPTAKGLLGESGNVSESITYTLDDGVLTISGSGPMQDYESASDSPWYSQKSDITKIVISEGITSIGARAFYQCSNVTEVKIASKVESIGTWAFNANTSLKEILIPESVGELADSSFRNCSSLEKVTFEGNAPDLGNYVFTAASSNLTIHCYENTAGWDGEGWSGYSVSVDHKFGEKNITKEPTCTENGEQQGVCLICGETITETIPALGHNYVDGVCTRCEDKKVISSGSCGTYVKYVLYQTGELHLSGLGRMTSFSSYTNVPWYSSKDLIKKVVIDSSIANIGAYAFYDCSNLESISDCSALEIENNAFYNCKSLKEVHVNSIEEWCNITMSGSYSNPLTASGNVSLYVDGNKVTELTIPEDVSMIRDGVFRGYDGLTSVTIPGSVTYIGKNVFKGCTNLTTVNILEGVTNVGDYAFSGCTSLTEITIPEGFRYIGEKVFENCSSLTSITLPEGLATIESSAFSGCSSLTSITIPDTLTNIEAGAFEDCSSLKDVYIDSVEAWCNITMPDSGSNPLNSSKNGSLYVKGLELTELTIPESVEKIGNWAFYGCSSIISVTIPDSVTEIGDGAFLGCSSITGLHIRESVERIGNWAFEDCSSLTSINIPDSVKVIGVGAFADCSDLVSITIPGSVTSLGGAAFIGCSSLTSITIPESVTGINKNTFKDCSSLASIDIPDSVTRIEEDAFSGCSSLASITIPESITAIPNNAFRNCTGLVSITIPESVTSIGIGAFDGCSALTSITLPFIGESKTKNNYFGYIFGAMHYGQNPSYVPASLKNVTITGDLTSISDSAFYDCSSIKSITISEGVTNIGKDAFSRCSSLTNITLPEGLATIESSAFSACSSLTSITIPNSVTSIGSGAFWYCSGLVSMTLPFVGCSETTDARLSEIYMLSQGEQSALEEVIITGNIKSIDDNAFDGFSTIKSITLPDSVENIGKLAFNNCSSLKSITIPESVTSIGEDAFNGCGSLTSINIPESIKRIPNNAFRNCSGLTSITIPESVTSIGIASFYGCTGLTSITVPESVGAIGISAFGSCSSLTSITLPFIGESSTSNTFLGHIFGAYDYSVNSSNVPASLREVTITGDITSINVSAFEGCSRLTSITIPESVTTIEEYAFSGCRSLTSITIPGNVTFIGWGAFEDCSGLKSIVIPESVTIIDKYAFSGCTGLTSITFPESVTSMDCYIIPDNSTLKSVYAVKGSYAASVFEDDPRLKYVTRSGEHYIYNNVKRATLTANGSVSKKCTICGETFSGTTIYYPKTFKLSASTYTYNGKIKKPTVRVTDSKGMVIATSNYTLVYSSTSPKNVGKYTVTVKFKGNYSGSKALTYYIAPKGTTVKSLTAAKKALTVKWTKQGTKMSKSYVTGYQIQLATDKAFKKNVKTVTAAKYGTVSKKVTGLKAKTNYYVRIRTYMKVGTKTYYSSWSGAKVKKTK